MPLNLRSTILVSLFIISLSSLRAQESLPQFGLTTHSSEYFNDRYLSSDLVHYLDNLDLYVTYQAETTGQYNQPDRMVFSIEGNSYRWNSYYLDGFRIDSRYFSGSTLYTPDMYRTSLTMDYIGSNLFFEQDRNIDASISTSFNVGGLGGISPGSKAMINLFHSSASERAYKPIEHRNKINGAGTFASTFFTEREGDRYYHHQYVDFGERSITYFDNTGIEEYNPELYLSAQFSGDIAMTLGSLFDSTHYLLNYSYRTDLNSEFYYGADEVARYNGYSASIYGSAKRGSLNYTSGVTLALHNTRHSDLNFSRNLLDQDGEAFEPFSPDGNSFELSHAILLNKELNDWLTLTFDGYNSLLYAAPTTNEFSNQIYTQAITEESPTPLYLYEWSAASYASGLLENSLRLTAEQKLAESLTLKADVGLTLDAILLGGGKSKVSPNIEAQAALSYNPNRWFSAELSLSRRRVAYTIEDLQFFSDDYMNGKIYYAATTSASAYESNYLTSTGGALHSLAKGAQQPAYWAFDLPINFTFGRHRISLLQSARKYVNNWIASYDKPASEYGRYVEDGASGTRSSISTQGLLQTS